MLVDINIKEVPEEVKQAIIESCGEYRDLSPIRERKGIYYSDLNFHYMVKNKLNSSPEFSTRNKKYINHLKDRLMSEDDAGHRSFILGLLNHEMNKPLKTFLNKRKHKRFNRKTYETFQEYGVCDNVEQIFKFYDFERDPRKFAIFLTPMYKEDQPSRGGWRWEKWGPYIGNKKSTADYLYDEDYIDMVYVYHIVEVLD